MAGAGLLSRLAGQSCGPPPRWRISVKEARPVLGRKKSIPFFCKKKRKNGGGRIRGARRQDRLEGDGFIPLMIIIFLFY